MKGHILHSPVGGRISIIPGLLNITFVTVVRHYHKTRPSEWLSIDSFKVHDLLDLLPENNISGQVAAWRYIIMHISLHPLFKNYQYNSDFSYDILALQRFFWELFEMFGVRQVWNMSCLRLFAKNWDQIYDTKLFPVFRSWHCLTWNFHQE